jgi:hypothetical protein
VQVAQEAVGSRESAETLRRQIPKAWGDDFAGRDRFPSRTLRFVQKREPGRYLPVLAENALAWLLEALPLSPTGPPDQISARRGESISWSADLARGKR